MGKTAAPTKHLEKGRGMKRSASKHGRHEDRVQIVKEIMQTQTYSIEAARANFPALVHSVAKGQEILLTENDRLIAKIVPPDEAEAFRRDMQALRGFAKGIPPFEREDEDRY